VGEKTPKENPVIFYIFQVFIFVQLSVLVDLPLVFVFDSWWVIHHRPSLLG
jgi:hypothetical protein